MEKIIRIFLMPLGFLKKFLEMANAGARDIENKFRFPNAIIETNCSINIQSKIHSNVHLLKACTVNNSEIHSYTYLGNNCLIQNTIIGKYCSIANDVKIGLGKHPFEYFTTSPLFYRKKNTFAKNVVEADLVFNEYQSILIGNDVWIGTNAIILDGLEIGHGAIIAANSVVTKDVPPYAIVAGVPAKIIKYRFDEIKIAQMLESQWWDMSITQIKKQFNIS
jgi:acetyltransferase-like isoleucine patch superfamily enzyme